MIGDSRSGRKHEGVPFVSNGTPFFTAYLNSSRFGVPFPFPVMTPAVEFVMIQVKTVADGWSPKVIDTIADPGAYTSTQVPQLEYDAFASVLVEAATVKTLGAPDGDSVRRRLAPGRRTQERARAP